MSIATEVSRIQSDRNTIRNKLIELGLATSTDNLDKLAAVIDDIINQGAVSVTVREGETYTIPKGYHNGSGTVSGIAGGGNYTLQSKSVTPTKKQQNVTPDSGYYGLSDVTVGAIPEAYQDVTAVTAAAGDVLSGKVYVLADGTITTGTMPNNGAVSGTLSATVVSYTIPKGYHSGTGKVTITLETKTVTPTKSTQKVTPTAGKVLSEVTVNPIPDNYIDTSDADALEGHILEGSTAYVDGEKVTGTMPNNAAINKVLTVGERIFTIPKGYHDGSGDVMIQPESKTVTPTKMNQTITPSTSKVLSLVTVEAIPDNYIDTTAADALAGHILEGKTAYVDGVKVTGVMPDLSVTGEVYYALSPSKPNMMIEEGYHNGNEIVNVYASSTDITPTKTAQTVNASQYYFKTVNVAAIPDKYVDTTDATAAAGNILSGKTAYVNSEKVTGTMANNGAVNQTIDGLTETSATIPAGYTSGGTVSLTSDIEEALAAI